MPIRASRPLPTTMLAKLRGLSKEAVVTSRTGDSECSNPTRTGSGVTKTASAARRSGSDLEHSATVS